MLLLSAPRIGRGLKLGLGAALLVVAVVSGLRLLAPRTEAPEAGELLVAPPAPGGETSVSDPRESAA